MEDVQSRSGYLFRLDSRSETPQIFYNFEMIPENVEYHEYLSKLSGKKRVQGVQYSNYRFVDRQDLTSEVERNVPLHLITSHECSDSKFSVGNVVQVNYHNSGKLFTAKIIRLDFVGGVCDVKYTIPVHLNFHTNPTTIPLCVEDKTLRVKKRQSVEFPGFRVDFTRVNYVKNFKSTESKRLHHLPNRCDHCEIEIELLASLSRNPAYIRGLQQVIVDLLKSMKLDENSFLFDAPPRPKMNPMLEKVLGEYSSSIGFNNNVSEVSRLIFQSPSRMIPESDWYALTEHVDGHWVDRREQVVSDSSSRMIFKDCVNDDLLKRAGLYIFGHHSCWESCNFDETFDFLCKRLRLSVVREIDDSNEESLRILKNILQKRDTGGAERDFLKSPLEFGKDLCNQMISNSKHAWWDEDEVAIVWNDVLVLAVKFATAFYYNIPSDKLLTFWETSDGDVGLYDLHRDLLKLGVITGFIQECRRSCGTFSTTISEEIELNKEKFCNREYSKYTQRELSGITFPNVKSVLLFDF
jgi:hypothetical protein